MNKINCNLRNSPLTTIFHQVYHHWIDFRNFYDNLGRRDPESNRPTKIPVLPKIGFDPNLPHINCHWVRNVGDIKKDPNSVVIIDNLTENINSKYYFDHYPKNKFYIIFSNGKWDEDFYPLPFKYAQVYYPYFLLEWIYKHSSHNTFLFHVRKNYDFLYPKKYNFISTAGSPRAEKDFFVYTFLHNLKHRDFIFKYADKDMGDPYYDPHLEYFSNGFNSNDSIPGLEKYFFSISDTIPIDLYNLGYFNLVVEGDIGWSNQFHITEKTIKTLLTGMPFVMVSSPHFLAELRTIGFKTYSDFWDESYDEIEDHGRRRDKITALCNELYSFDWQANKEKLKAIGDHNRANFFNLQGVVDTSMRQFESVLDSSIPVDISQFKID